MSGSCPGWNKAKCWGCSCYQDSCTEVIQKGKEKGRCGMSYLFLVQAVDDLRGHRVSHVGRQQGSRVVLGLNAGRAHLLPPGGHGLRVPRLVYRDCGKRDSGKLSPGHRAGATNPDTSTWEHSLPMKSNFWLCYMIIFQIFSTRVLDCNSSLKQNVNYSQNSFLANIWRIDLNH